MGGIVELGKLVIRLVGDISSLESSMAKGKTQVQGFEKQSQQSTEATSKHWTRLGIEIAIATAIIVRGINSAAQSATELRNASISTGESVEALSKLEFAAKAVGATFADVEASAKAWQATLATFARGDVSDATQAVTALGLSIRDSSGDFRSFSDILPDLLDKLSTMPDGFRKTDLATKAFGSSFEKLLALSKDGSSTLADLIKRAQELGVIMDKEGAEQAAKYTAAIAELSAAWAKLGGVLAYVTAGPFKSMIDFFAQGIKDTEEWLDNVRLRTWRKEWEVTSEAINKLGESLKKDIELLDRLESMPNALTDPANVAAINAVKERLDATRESMSKLMEKMQEFSNRAQGGREIRIEAPLIPPTPNINPQDLKDVVAQVKKELEEVQDALQGMPYLFSRAFTIDPKGFQDGYDAILRAQAAGVVSAQQAAKMKLQLQRQEQAEILNTASLAASTLTAVFGKSKLAAIGSALINTAVGVTKALSASPPPYNFINAALVAASGAAQIAAIKSTTETGGGSSGAVSGGGSSGSGSGGDNAPPTPAPRTLFIEGISGAGQFSVAAVRSLIEQINAEVKEGAVLVVQ
jgi:hypothetical protein